MRYVENHVHNSDICTDWSESYLNFAGGGAFHTQSTARMHGCSRRVEHLARESIKVCRGCGEFPSWRACDGERSRRQGGVQLRTLG